MHIRTILPNLGDVALTVLTAPHSNATEEQLFSIICENKTEFPSRLNFTPLNAIIVVKMSKAEVLLPCNHGKGMTELLKACKRACMKCN